MKKKKILIIYNKVWHYREKIFEKLNDEVDLTVGFSDNSCIGKQYTFKTKYLPLKNIGPFAYHKDDLHKICSDYDVVIGIFNIRWLSLISLAFKKARNYKLIFWGIGVRASYKHSFGSKTMIDKMRFLVARKAEAIIFYSTYPVKRYIDNGVSKDKIFIAHNTVPVAINKNIDWSQKTNFLFIGTLYAPKKIQILIKAYEKLMKKNLILPKLDIIGNGPELEKIERLINDINLTNKVFLHGGIYETKKISSFYKHAVACISPGQAGLSVLTSMGNATIFITEKGAITGGEILNIKNKENGIIYEGGVDALARKMEWIIENKEAAIEMCKSAFEHYQKKRSPELMHKEILKAINYSLK